MIPKIAIIGPLTKDKIIFSNRHEYISPGGSAFYCGEVLARLGAETTLYVTLSEKDNWLTKQFSNNIKIVPIFKSETAYFENIYPRKNMDYRIQKARSVNNTITIDDLKEIDFNRFDYVILGPLYANDLNLETIKYISKFNTKICLEIQGFLRVIRDEKVVLTEFVKHDFLKYVDLVIMNNTESKYILSDAKPKEVCEYVASFGPEKVILTKGSKGSLIYSKRQKKFYNIPSFVTPNVVDATGAGDNYLAGYVMKCLETEDLNQIGRFAAMTATIKLEKKGPFDKDKKTVETRLKINNLLIKENLKKDMG